MHYAKFGIAGFAAAWALHKLLSPPTGGLRDAGSPAVCPRELAPYAADKWPKPREQSPHKCRRAKKPPRIRPSYRRIAPMIVLLSDAVLTTSCRELSRAANKLPHACIDHCLPD